MGEKNLLSLSQTSRTKIIAKKVEAALDPVDEGPTFVAAHESAHGRYCCKSPKIPGDVFFERNEAKLFSPFNMAPRPLAKPPVSLSLGDEVPHIFIRESHQWPRKNFDHGGKRLLQQNRQ